MDLAGWWRGPDNGRTFFRYWHRAPGEDPRARGPAKVNVLSPQEAYRLWAPAYSAETAISQLEDELVARLTPPLRGLSLLDAGCGTGRRLAACGASEAVGVDICPEMLDAARATGVQAEIADIVALPFADQSFDVVWCRLVIGHVADCAAAYREIGRVLRRGGQLIVSDFHPAAHAAGHRRTFRAAGVVHEIEHHVRDAGVLLDSAREAGLEPIAVEEACIGPSVRGFYERSGRGALYGEHVGLPVVLAASFRKGGAKCAA